MKQGIILATILATSIFVASNAFAEDTNSKPQADSAQDILAGIADKLKSTANAETKEKEESFRDFGKPQARTKDKANNWNPLSKERKNFSDYLSQAFANKGKPTSISSSKHKNSQSKQNSFKSFGVPQEQLKTFSAIVMEMMEEVKAEAVKTRDGFRRNRQR
jgi:hypothetical protein